MFGYRLLKQSKKSRARLGVISTPHGDIETPAFVPVATRASVRTLESHEAADVGSQLLICNTFHLHLTPGEETVKKAGGLHRFMKWDKPLMTDSGGFQVFSFGFGRDHGMGKILKPGATGEVTEDTKPKGITITDDGVQFRSPIDGAELFLNPEESIRIQEALGADIIYAFDECPSPLSDEAYMRKSLERTHAWAKRSLDAKTRPDQALYGVVQGGGFKNLRTESAKTLGAMDFDGFGIGGEFGADKQAMSDMVGWTVDELPQEKPRHLLGIGHPEDFEPIVAAGVDTFDCIAPTHYARHGIAFTRGGRLDLRKRALLDDFSPLDPECGCFTCATYTRSYIAHLFRANEVTGLKLATVHNLSYFNELAAKLRERIKNDDI